MLLLLLALFVIVLLCDLDYQQLFLKSDFFSNYGPRTACLLSNVARYYWKQTVIFLAFLKHRKSHVETGHRSHIFYFMLTVSFLFVPEFFSVSA
jgi:hypothetical protein